jgi:hypothetical protein
MKQKKQKTAKQKTMKNNLDTRNLTGDTEVALLDQSFKQEKVVNQDSAAIYSQHQATTPQTPDSMPNSPTPKPFSPHAPALSSLHKPIYPRSQTH